MGFLSGFFQVGVGFILITVGARNTPSAMIGIIMLTEAVLGPLWAWLFVNEDPPVLVLVGGSIIILAVFSFITIIIYQHKNQHSLFLSYRSCALFYITFFFHRHIFFLSSVCM